MKDKIAKAKSWIKDHEDVLIFGGSVAVYAAAVGGCLVLAVKMQNKQLEAEANTAQTIAEAVSRGASVLPAGEMGYWIIEPK